MATVTFTGNAAALKDICTLTVSGTWVAGETGTLTINGKDLVVTAGTAVTTSDIATLLAAAWNASTRLNDATSGSSNFGGQEFGEYAEVTATSSGAVLTLTANAAGIPFQASLTRSDTAGSGAIGAVTSVQAATGPKFWDNADNWDSGSVPANNDTVVFRDSAVDCCYGLPNASKEVDLRIYNSYTGKLGLPKINTAGGSQRTFYEYRQRYVRLDDAGAASAGTHVIGIGPGAGPGLVNIRHATLAQTFEIDVNTSPPSDGTKTVNVVCAAGAVIKARKGSIDLGDQDGVTASVTALTMTARGGSTSEIDITSLANASTACTVVQNGGKLTIDWASWATNGLTLNKGECHLYTAGCASAEISEGTLFDYGGAKTIAALTLNNGGVLDVSRGAGTLTLTNATYYEGCKVVNPGERITHSNAIATRGRVSVIAQNLDYGYNRTLQIAG